MKLLYRTGADALWVTHFSVVVMALFGWLIPWLWPVYIAVLVGTLASTLMFGYCILSKWEYQLRREADPEVEYDFSYASYYTYRLTRGHISPKFLAQASVIFVSLSLAANIYFHLA